MRVAIFCKRFDYHSKLGLNSPPLGIAADTGPVAKAWCSMSGKPGPMGNRQMKIREFYKIDKKG